jgi:hypothetical protein
MEWYADLLDYDDGSQVRLQLWVTSDGPGGSPSSIKVEQVWWDVEYAGDSAGDIAFTVPQPSLFAAAKFMPVSGTTGWLQPIKIKNDKDSGVTVSNVSNMAAEDTDVASVNLQGSGGATVQESKTILWDWVDPANYPAGAEIVGIELLLYAQYDSVTGISQRVYPYEFSLEHGGVIETLNESNNQVPQDTEASPLYSNVLHWGGETELFDLAPNTLVSEALERHDLEWPSHGSLKMRSTTQFPASTSTVKMAFVTMKLWWEVPNYVDMAATPSFSVGIDDSAAPLQRIFDIASDMSASMTASVPRVAGVPYTIYADANFSVVIDPPTISEGSTYIDMACWMMFDVTFEAAPVRVRNLYTDIEFGVDSIVYVGYSNPLYADFAIAVDMDPQLHRDVEMQTDALGAWFDVTMDVDGLVGTLALATNIPISMTMNVDGMRVNWALYAEAQFSVTATPYLASMTNVYSDMEINVTMDPQLHSIINIAADFTMSGLLFNAAFIRLPVPAPEERTMYLKPKGRVMKIPAKGRKLTLTSN